LPSSVFLGISPGKRDGGNFFFRGIRRNTDTFWGIYSVDSFFSLLLPSHYKITCIHSKFKIIMENENNNNQLQIELKDEVAQGTYANLAIITHSTSEFIIDFVRIMPGLPKAGVQSRIVMTPEHAKRLMYALQDNVSRYEQAMGTIRMPEEMQQQNGNKTFVPPLSDFKGEA
jgi:hypothetical protein